MTRINVVPPSELENVHLLAEYRELPRVFSLATSYYYSGKKRDFPKEYTLGTGHVKFFYDKLKWLYNRQVSLIQELEKRGYTLNFKTPEDLLKDLPEDFFNDYIVTENALKINRERIAIRLASYREKIAKK